MNVGWLQILLTGAAGLLCWGCAATTPEVDERTYETISDVPAEYVAGSPAAQSPRCCWSAILLLLSLPLLAACCSLCPNAVLSRSSVVGWSLVSARVGGRRRCP